jgi:hypothetical protein
MKEAVDLAKYRSFIETSSLVKKTGRLSRIIGLLIEADGPGVASGSPIMRLSLPVFFTKELVSIKERYFAKSTASFIS